MRKKKEWKLIETWKGKGKETRKGIEKSKEKLIGKGKGNENE